ncbi:MAG: DUF2339 domain-containing protein [Candidatus Electrothrix sp. Rat3]|nr:DUF2339 domain-containing protein [Candidatus Electrothrix rattekaaiensis]
MIETIIIIIIGGILFVGIALVFLLVRTSAQKKLLKRMEKRLEKHEALLRSFEKAPEQPVAAADSPIKEQKEQSAVHQAYQKAEAAKSEVIFTPVETTADDALDDKVEEKQSEQERSRPGRLQASPDKPVSNPSFVTPPPPPSASPTSDPVERAIAYVQRFFTQGNVVLRVGLLVLFFGVSFLLKYAADHSMLPLELRLLGVALAGIAMLLFGWHLRLQRSGFALLMQGGGIGLLFLDVFAAFKLYHLLPAALAFALMLGLVCTSAALALLQDAKSLALFGATGGFLAPVLLSSGSGNHVALFSYYALLNAGILIIAWFKAWRELNLLGFFFTLGIGSFWGVSSYKARYFASTEPFLVLFFLMFTFIGVLFAFRQPPKLRGYVDGTLVFGTPIICFSLQTALVKDIQYGLAISALLVSLFYIGLARFLWNKGNERLRQGMRTLTEAFLALGIVFVTLAVPLALSGRWTAVTWAMEGAALIWLGVRQNRILPRNFGLLLQLAAGIFFLTAGHVYDERILLFNGTYSGAVIVSLSALFSSWYLYRADNLRSLERYHHYLLFFWGIIWWFGAGIDELGYQVPYFYHDYAVLLLAGLSCAVMMTLARRISWPIAAWPSLLLLPLMVCLVPDTILQGFFYPGKHLFAQLGWLVWPVTFGLLHYCLSQGRGLLSERLLCFTHIGGYLLFVLVLTSEAVWMVRVFGGRHDTWELIVWALVPLALLQLVQSSHLNRYWPLSDYAAQYQKQGSGVIAVLLWLWLVISALRSPGNAAPLPFVPFFNPLELSQLIVFLIICRWLLLRRNYVGARIPLRFFTVPGGATAFLWLNAALARSVHHFGEVPFVADAMFDSRLYQAAVSIFWSALSLILMVTAHRLKNRVLWLIGAGLVGITVIKLFLVDLANSGTVERIVSFLAVGVLLMIIGYFAPLPPARIEQEEVS